MSPFLFVTFLLATIFVAHETSGMSRRAACDILCGDDEESSGGPYWTGRGSGVTGRGSYCRFLGGNCQPRGWCGTAQWSQADCDRSSGQVCCMDRRR